MSHLDPSVGPISKPIEQETSPSDRQMGRLGTTRRITQHFRGAYDSCKLKSSVPSGPKYKSSLIYAMFKSFNIEGTYILGQRE